jgi:L-fuculose-phosphate aldolase
MLKNAEMTELQLRNELVETGRLLYEKGLIVANEGNISVRLDAQTLLATPSGLCKGRLHPDDLVKIRCDGTPLSNHRPVSSEIKMHLAVYAERPDVQAVIHAHPPACLSLMLAGFGLDQPILAESVVLMGRVPTAPYARPSTSAVPESIRPFIHSTDFILLDRHGSLTVGSTLWEAFQKQEMMEHTAKIYRDALLLGEVKLLPPEEITALNDLRINRYRIPYLIIPF